MTEPQQRRALEGWLVRPLLSDDLRIQLRASDLDLPPEAAEGGGAQLTDADCEMMSHCGTKNGDCGNLRSCNKYDESKR